LYYDNLAFFNVVRGGYLMRF